MRQSLYQHERFYQITFLAKKYSWNLINVGLNPLK